MVSEEELGPGGTEESVFYSVYTENRGCSVTLLMI